MSDTPRTDAAERLDKPSAYYGMCDHARQLERELAAAKKEIVHLRGQIDFASRDNANLLMAKCAAAASDRDEAILERNMLREHIDRRAKGTDPLTAALVKERDEARECLGKAIAYIDGWSVWMPLAIIPAYKRWRKAAGLDVKP